MDRARDLAFDGNYARAFDVANALERAASEDGPLAVSALAELKASVFVMRWDWIDAMRELERSRDIQERENSRHAADLTASRVEWLAGHRAPSIARARYVMESGSWGSVEGAAALAVGFRTESMSTPDRAYETWSMINDHFGGECPPGIAFDVALAMGRLESAAGDPTAASAWIRRAVDSANTPYSRSLAEDLLDSSARHPAHRNPLTDPVYRGRRHAAEVAAQGRSLETRQLLIRLHARAADCGQFKVAHEVLWEYLELERPSHQAVMRADRLVGPDPFELAVWYAAQTGDRRRIVASAELSCGQLVRERRSSRARALAGLLERRGLLPAAGLASLPPIPGRDRPM